MQGIRSPVSSRMSLALGNMQCSCGAAYYQERLDEKSSQRGISMPLSSASSHPRAAFPLLLPARL
jgi:hypothetical protein